MNEEVKQYCTDWRILYEEAIKRCLNGMRRDGELPACSPARYVREHRRFCWFKDLKLAVKYYLRWVRVVPHHVAAQQAKLETSRSVVRALKSASIKDVASVLRIRCEDVHIVVNYMKRFEHIDDPVTQYFANDRRDLLTLLSDTAANPFALR